MATKLNYDELRTVFDACDPSRSGFITFDDFAGLARQYGSVSDALLRDAEQLVCDKENRLLSFHEFSNMIARIRNGNGTDQSDGLNDYGGPASIIDISEPNLISFDDTNGSDKVVSQSPHSTTVNSITTTTTHSITNGLSSNDRVEAAEDRYEDFGVAEASEFDRNESVRGSLTIRRVGTMPDTSAPPAYHSSSSYPRGSATRSRSTKQTHSEAPNGGSLNVNDEFIGNLDSNFDVLHDRMQSLQHQVEHLSKSQEKSESKSTQLKLENQRLTDRANALEEQLHETRLRSERDLSVERQRYRDLQAKYDREVVDLAELTKSRIQLLEASNNDLRNDGARLRADNDRLKTETQRIESELREARSTCDQVGSEHRKCSSKIAKLQKQIDEQKQIIASLSGEFDPSRLEERPMSSSPKPNYRADESRSLSPSITSRISELEEQVKRLASENRLLKEQNEELHGSILSGSFDRGRRLIFQRCMERQNSVTASQRGTLCIDEDEDRSLAAELEQLNEQSRDDIMEQLIKEKEANQKLRVYVDNIILKVLEKHPEILEVK